MFRFLFVCLVLVLASSSVASPVSHAMAQCSALTYALSKWSDDPEQLESLTEASDQWFDMAFDAALDEGISQPFETLTNIANQAENAWLSKGKTVVYTGDFREWSNYCDALGRLHGLNSS